MELRTRSQTRMKSQTGAHRNENNSGPQSITTTAKKSEHDTDTTDNVSYSTFGTSPPVASDLPAGKTTTKMTSRAIEEMLRRVNNRQNDASDWKGKIQGVYNALQDVEMILQAYAEGHNEPKVDALGVMLDTIINCMVGDRNVHTFMDDEAWIRKNSSVE